MSDNNHAEVDLNGLPLIEIPQGAETIYADVVVGMAVGPQVSRIILGQELSENKAKITTTVVIPTTAMMGLVGNANRLLKNSELHDAMLNQLRANLEQFSKGADD